MGRMGRGRYKYRVFGLFDLYVDIADTILRIWFGLRFEMLKV